MTLIHDGADAARSTVQHLGERLRPGKSVNVGDTERWASAVGGGLLACYGLNRGGLGGVLALVGGTALVYRGVSGYCTGYDALGMNTAAGSPAEPRQYFERGIHVEASVTIDRTPWDLYAFWKNLENLPSFMRHLKAVTRIDDRRSHWEATAPAGTTVAWDAEIINDEPNALIAWRSLAGATVDNAGSVRFVPGPAGRGTDVRVVLDYIPPAGKLGAAVAGLFGEAPSQTIQEDLGRFKQLMESGATTATAAAPPGGDVSGA